MKDIFNEKIKDLLDTISEKEQTKIEQASLIIYQAMRKDGLLHVFCTGHSHMMAEELFYRAGGLVQVNPILEPFLMQHEGAVRSTKFERLTGVAEILFGSIGIKPGEPLLIASNSGINVV
ncbi:MAG: SIS domain-containing protein, partial [Clostridia bacterium]